MTPSTDMNFKTIFPGRDAIILFIWYMRLIIPRESSIYIDSQTALTSKAGCDWCLFFRQKSFANSCIAEISSFSVKQTTTGPPLSMKLSDFELMERELNLHPSTLQYVRRAMKASRFWGPDSSTLSNTPGLSESTIWYRQAHQSFSLSRHNSRISPHSTHTLHQHILELQRQL